MTDAERDRETDPQESDPGDPDDREHVAHLADLPDGCGCAEIWEYTASQRRS